MAEKIRMNVDDVLELDYLIEDISNNVVNVNDEPSDYSTEIGYIRKEIGVFDPPGSGTYELEINGQIYRIEVTDIPESAIEKFEDGDTSGWANFRGSDISAVGSTANGGSAYNGEYAGEVICDSGTNTSNYYDLSDPISPNSLSVAVRVENQSDSNDRGYYSFESGDTSILNVWLRNGSGISFNHQYSNWSKNNIGGFSEDKWYKIDFLDIDWDAEIVGSIMVNRSEELSSVSFNNSASSIDRYWHDCAGQTTLQSYSDDRIPQ